MPRQLRAVQPVYVGWVQVWPLSNEKYTPEPPMRKVNGQVVSSPALHASSSMLSFAPAARIFGACASMATAGSFCLFCENGVDGLPDVTIESVPNAKTGTASKAPNTAATKTDVLCMALPPPNTPDAKERPESNSGRATPASTLGVAVHQVLEGSGDVAQSLLDLAELMAVVTRISLRPAACDLVDEARYGSQLAGDPLKGLDVRFLVRHGANLAQAWGVVSTRG